MRNLMVFSDSKIRTAKKEIASKIKIMKKMDALTKLKEDITGNPGLLSNSFWLEIAGPCSPGPKGTLPGEQAYLKIRRKGGVIMAIKRVIEPY